MTKPYAPTWLSPLAAGAMSNKRGSNTGADSLAFQIKYNNPRVTAAPIGSIRFLATKTATAGAQTGQVVTALDSWWLGAGALTDSPLAAGDVRTNSVFQYDAGSGLRAYAMSRPVGAPGALYSAPLNGPSIGTWRSESMPPLAGLNPSITTASVIQSGGYCYVSATLGTTGGSIWYAPFNTDGTLGTWKFLSATNGIAPTGDVMLGAFSDTSGSFIIEFGTGGTATRGAKVNIDGTIGTNNAWITGGALPATRAYCGVYFAPSGLNDGNGTLWLIGGFDGTATWLLTVTSAPVTLGNGTIGAWANGANGIPAARANFGFVPSVPTSGGFLYVVGGSTTAGAIGTPATTTIYRILSSNLGGSVWTTDAVAASNPVSGLAFYTFVPGAIQTGSATDDKGCATILCPSNPGTANTTKIRLNNAGTAVSTSSSNPGSVALTAANVGAAGGVLTANADGSIDVTYLWQAGAIGTTALVDGDQVTISAQTTDQSGDPGPSMSTVFKIGQPPTLGSVLPGAAIATGQPTASFNFLSGAGGGPEYSWRVTVKIGATVYFDSGTRYDQANSVLVNLAPLLLTATAYTFTWTASTNDALFNGATGTVTSTLAVTPTITAPAAPTTLAAVPDNANGVINLTWVNPTPPATPGGRVYYRRNGASAWTLLYNQATAVAAYAAMDQIAIGVAYDFAVSQLNLASPNAIESPLSNIVSNVKLDLGAVGGCFLHIAGNGATYKTPLSFRGSPRYISTTDAALLEGFGSLAMTVRYGVLNYSALQFEAFVPSLAVFQALMNVIQQAQLGNSIYYRDGNGLMLTVALDPTQEMTYMAPVYRYIPLKFVQVPNRFATSLTLGAALGIPVLTNQSMPPLDVSEMVP